MKEPKRYSCGNGEGMFEDDKNGYWIEYTKHKAIVDALTKQLCLTCVSGKEYVDNMVKLIQNSCEPSQIEDKNDPMLWKAEYWKWFLTTDR